MKRAAAVIVAVVLAGCAGGSSQPSRAEVMDVLGQETTAGNTDPAEAGCIADEMLAAGLTSGQLDEAAGWDGQGEQPEAVDMYNVALDECGLSVEDRLAEAAERIDDA